MLLSTLTGPRDSTVDPRCPIAVGYQPIAPVFAKGSFMGRGAAILQPFSIHCAEKGPISGGLTGQ